MEYGRTPADGRSRNNFTLFLDTGDAKKSPVDAANNETNIYTWAINWGTIISAAYDPSAKFRVTHSFTSSAPTPEAPPILLKTNWVGLQGLPGMQAYTSVGTAGGLIPINTARAVAPVYDGTAVSYFVEAAPVTFVCGNPATNMSHGQITLALLNLPFSTAKYGSGITGLHRLEFELICDE